VEAGGLRIVGAGLGRTGTNSLKLALETLLGGGCYHMFELIQRPAHTAGWHAAIRGARVNWQALLSDYVATVDWPACAFWRELSEANPEALILLSTRESPAAWWRSVECPIVALLDRPVPTDDPEWQARRAMTMDMMSRFASGWSDPAEAIAGYERHNAEVRAEVPPDRLIDWQPGDGWEPICSALDLPVPTDSFPHANRSEDFRAQRQLD
jgi:hypothetical protein